MEDFVGISEIIPSLADSVVDARPAAWQKEGRDNSVRRNVAIAFAELHLYELARGIVESEGFETLNGKPADGDLPSDASWGVSREAAERIRQSLKLDDLPGNLWSRINQKADEREARESRYQVQEEAKRVARRYTLQEAWIELARATGWEPKRWKDILLQEIRDGKLPLRNPSDYSDRLPYTVPNHMGADCDQVDADALNKWLGSHSEWAVSYRFPASSAAPQGEPTTQSVPLPRQLSQEQEILRVISELGYQANALPRRSPGQSGVKAEVRKRLALRESVFDKAWKRLRSTKQIIDEA
ncbi:MAG: hypothetical protein WBE92_18105 [Steroidobacteraceae bacterium]